MKSWGLGNLFSSLALPAGMQKKLVSFLLQRAIGHFLEDDIDLERLDIELSNGIVHLTNLRLNTKVLNDLTAGAQLAVTAGSIASITATIPWRNLWSGQVVLEIQGIDIVLVPVQANQANDVDLEEMMASSMLLANDFLKRQPGETDKEADLQDSIVGATQTALQQPLGIPGDFNSRRATAPPPPPLSSASKSPSSGTSSDQAEVLDETRSNTGENEGEGIQFVARLIETLMARIQVIVKDTRIRLRHKSSQALTRDWKGTKGASLSADALPREHTFELELCLPYIAYRDETPGWDTPHGKEASTGSASVSASTESILEESSMPSIMWQDTPESIKTVTFKGFSVWIKEKHPSTLRRKEKKIVEQQPPPPTVPAVQDQNDDSDSDADVFLDAEESIHQSVIASRHLAPRVTFEAPLSSKTSAVEAPLYNAQILSTSSHKNRIKVNMRRNATFVTGGPSISQPALSVAKSVMEIDIWLRPVQVVLSPGQVGFLLEILNSLEDPPVLEAKQDEVKSQSGGSLPIPSGSTNTQYFEPHSEGIRGQFYGPNGRRSDFHNGRPASISSQGSMSPRRNFASDAQRVTQGSPQRRSLEQERPYTQGLFEHGQEPDAYLRPGPPRSTSAAATTSTSSMDSSRFMSASILSESRKASLANSTGIKLKARLPSFQVYLLLADPSTMAHVPNDENFYRDPEPAILKRNHLKLELDGMIFRYHQSSSPALSVVSGARLQSQKPFKSSHLDFTLNNVILAEWLEDHAGTSNARQESATKDQFRVPKRGQYTHVIEFDTTVDGLQAASAKERAHSKFLTIPIPPKYQTEYALAKETPQSSIKRPQKSNLAPHSRQAEIPTASPLPDVAPINKEVVRMRINLGGKPDSSRPSTPTQDGSSASGFAQVVTIEVKPFHVHLDLHMLTRLEPIMLILSKPKQLTASDSTSAGKASGKISEQQIFNDLDIQRRPKAARSKLRLRLNNMRIWISVPDMASTLAQAVDTGPEFRSIHDMVVLDISKLTLTSSSDNVSNLSSAQSTPTSDANSLAKVEFTTLSAFFVSKHAKHSEAIVRMTSQIDLLGPSGSGASSVLPNIEVTMRSAESIMNQQILQGQQSAKPQGNRFMQAFAVLEGDENSHTPEVEEEDVLVFKQQTIETSLLVLNCYFPLIAAHLEKARFDQFQLRLNDMSAFLTIFAESLAAKVEHLVATNSLPLSEATIPCDTSEGSYRFNASEFNDNFGDQIPASEYGGDRDDQSEHETDQSTAYGEELRNQARGMPSDRMHARHYHQPRRQLLPPPPTLLSILIRIPNLEVTLDYLTAPSTLDPIPILKSYQLNVGDARIFVGAKYQGGQDTYVSVDAEDLDLWEVTAQRPKTQLLTRTIPKGIKLKAVKPMFAMTSLLSTHTDINFKENNTILTFTGISWKFSVEQTAVDDVQDFFSEPADIVQWKPPGQCTKVNVALQECCMDYKPLHIPMRFVLMFEKMKVASVLRPESPTLTSKIQIYHINLFLLDDVRMLLQPQHPAPGSNSSPGIDMRIFWKSLGFASIGICSYFQLDSVKNRVGQLPHYDIQITNQHFRLETCADSFETLVAFAGYVGGNGDLPPEKKVILQRLAEAESASNRAKSNVIYQDVLASLDEEAFRQPRQGVTEGDRSTSLDFVEGFFSVDREDSPENDLSYIKVRESKKADGFNEVYADLIDGSTRDSKHGGKPLSKDSARPSSFSKRNKHVASTADQTFASSSNKSPQLLSQAVGTGNSSMSRQGSRRSDDRSECSGAKSTKKFVNYDSHGNWEDIFRVLDEDAEFLVRDDHFSVPVATREEVLEDKKSSMAVMRLRIRDFNFSWSLYDGLDWEISRLDDLDRKRQAQHIVKKLHNPAAPIHDPISGFPTEIDAAIFEHISGLSAQDGSLSPSRRGSIAPDQDLRSENGDSPARNHLISRRGSYSSVARGHGGVQHQAHPYQQHHQSSQHQTSPTETESNFDHLPRSSTRRNRHLERSVNPLMDVNLVKLFVDFENYVAGLEYASRLSVKIREFEMIDHIETSAWHKFLSPQRPDSKATNPRPSHSNMVRIELEGVRPVPSASTVEFRLKCKILPLRMYIDQDALVFLIRFFNRPQGVSPVAGDASDGSTTREPKKPPGSGEMYFQSIKLGDLSAKVDYKPKHVNYTGISGGNLVELMNLFHLSGSELNLHAVELHGVNGFGKMSQELFNIWLPHIKATQLPNMVSGLGPIRSLVNIGTGFADLILIPVEEYKRDGHLIRGLQKGGQSFARTTTLEALKLGTKLAVGTQVLLEHADEIFGSKESARGLGSSSGPSSPTTTGPLPGEYDMLEGFEGARTSSHAQEQQHHHYQQRQQQQRDSHGRQVVATMVSDTEAYMHESLAGDNPVWGSRQPGGGHEYNATEYEIPSATYGGAPQRPLNSGLFSSQQSVEPTGTSGLSGGGVGSSPGGPTLSTLSGKDRKLSKYANQPADVGEGMELAFKSLSKNIGTAAHTIFAVPMEVYEQTGAQGTVRAVIRAVPVAVLKPMIGTTEALSKVLIGIRNSIDPVQKLKMEDKYKK